MKKRNLLLGVLMVLTLAVLVGCTAQAPSNTAVPLPTATVTAESTATPDAAVSASPASSPEAEGVKTFTLEELAAYNGKDGNPAYVAVDGIVYDVTNSNFWRNGGHNGFSAGNDLTTEIKEKSPHGVDNLKRVPVVGELKK